MTGEEMVKEFLCPGCVCGMDTLHLVSPRINYLRTFVLEGRTFAELPPGVVNVSEFYEEMD
jgi:hypothetical protein